MQKILVIQTAFIGDVVLSTALLASLHNEYPEIKLDILVRKGNEALFNNHPYVNAVLVWNKKENKYKHWLQILLQIRNTDYDVIINVQRYAATGLWTAFSSAKIKIGFDKNPFSFLFTHKIKHLAEQKGLHEIQKNHALLSAIGDLTLCKPKLYPTAVDELKVLQYQSKNYICIAPASVWYTKQFPIQQWVNFLNELVFEGVVYIIGGPGDKALGDTIINNMENVKIKVVNLAGQLDFLAAAALQKKAVLNYVNDSAPMHFASAVNAPVVAIYCSTIPDFGYGPLSDKSFIVQTNKELSCRPCGIHGKKACPLGHFSCATSIQMQQLLEPLSQMAQH